MNKKLRILIPIIIVVIVCIIFATHAESLQSFIDAITTADTVFILCAVVVLAGRYLMYAWAFQAGFRAVGARISLSKLIEIVFSITFINDTAPTAGMAGSVYLASWATRKGASTGGALSLFFLDKITFFGSFALIQTAGLILLAVANQLSFILVLGSCIIYGLAIMFVIALYVSYKSPRMLTKILNAVVFLSNKLSRFTKKGISQAWAINTAQSAQEAAHTIAANPKQVLLMFLRMFCLFLCEFASIAFVCLSLGFTEITGIVAAYVAGFIMSMCVVQTVGIIEAILVVMLTAFGADFGIATAISLAYRGLLFWIPFALGAVCIHRTSKDFMDKDNEALQDETIFERANLEGAAMSDDTHQSKTSSSVAPDTSRVESGDSKEL